MGEPIDFYVNMLQGNMGGLSAVSALKSLDDAAAKATSGIRSLEEQVGAAKAKLETIKSGGDIEALASRLATARQQLDAIKSGKVPFNPKEYERASNEVGKLGSQLDSAKSKQANAVAAQQSKIESLTGKIKEQKDAQASSANLVQAKRALMVKGLDEQVSKLGKLGEAAKAAGIPGAGLVDKLSMLAKAGPAAAAFAVAAAFLAVAAAAVVAVVALTRYVLAAADAARSSRLLSDAATGSAAGGEELEAVVNQLAGTIPQAREQTAQWARELALAGLAGRDMQRTLTAMGTVSAAVGDQAAGKIRGIAEASRMAQRFMLGARDRFGEFASLQGTGIKAADVYAAVAKSMKTSIPEAERLVRAGIVPFRKGLEALETAAQTKFGPIVERQMMSLTVLGSKLGENFKALFAGVNIEPFLKGLKSIVDLFDENTVLGYALKTIFGEVFTWISDKAAVVFPYIRAFLLGIALGAIYVAAVVKKLATTISTALGLDGMKSLVSVETAFYAGAAAIALVTGALVGLAAVWLVNMAAMAVAALVAWAPLILGAAAIALAVYGFYKLAEAASGLWDELKDVDLAKIAGDIMDGLINGIKAKISAVKDAILEVSTAITSVFATDQEQHSPGRKAMRQGKYVTQGHAIGIEQGIPMVERASMGVSKAVTGGLEGDSGGAGGGAGGPVSVTINVYGRDDGDEVARKVDERLAIFFLSRARGEAMATP